MKIKNPKFFSGSLIAFMLIAGFDAYQHYKTKKESKTGYILEQMMEETSADKLISPAKMSADDVEIPETVVKMGK